MYTKVGKRIKTIAKITCLVCVILFIILGLYLIFTGIQLNKEYKANGAGNNIIIIGCSLLIGGPIGSWLSNLGMYAMGELVENSALCVENSYKCVKALKYIALQQPKSEHIDSND